jgi:hypothetical protein
VLSRIGIATSIGHTLQVPIIVRSLADSIALLDEDDLPLAFDLDFKLMLDVDPSFQHSLCKLVDVYSSAWWKRNKPRSLDLADILEVSSFKRCLETHKHQLADAEDTTSDIPSIPNSPKSPPPRTSGNSCPKCGHFSQILSNALQDLVNVHELSNTMVTSHEAQWNMSMRRASTFNLLHEAAVVKDVADVAGSPSPTPVVSPDSVAETTNSVAEIARKNLAHLQSLPPSSHKWTWGERLTEKEVLDLARSGTRPKKKIHSGYDVSLIDGKRYGGDSSIPSMPISTDILNISGPQSMDIIPELTTHISIPYFENKQFTSYDPLGKYTVLASASAGQNEGQGNTSGGSPTDNTAIEDLWVSDHSDGPGNASAVSADIETNIEDLWEPENVINSEQIEDVWESEAPAEAIEDIWESDKDSTAEMGSPIDEVGDSDHNQENLPEEIEDLWEPASEQENSEAEIEDLWEPASEQENSEAESEKNSSVPTANSQLVVSPSRITIPVSNRVFPLSDVWPDLDMEDPTIAPNSSLETPAPIPFRRFGPEDFPHLQDHMFEDVNTDSDSDGLYD